MGDVTESKHINIKVCGQDNSTMIFKMKQHAPLAKLMSAYCNRANFSINRVRFRFDGRPIAGNDTPAILKLEEGDVIDVYQQQDGGCRSN